MAEQFDVLICGSGSAGLCAAIWLARCGINFRVLEQRGGPLQHGQADGVQCRTVEIFESLGISEMLLKEAYHVLELAFWSSDGKAKINRTHYAPDTEPGLSHQPHVILNQARINDLMIEEIVRLSGQKGSWIQYGSDVQSVRVDDEVSESTASDVYPVEVQVVEDGKEKLYKAKYVLGCDGAHSKVRRSLGFQMIGDTTNAVWGVMDVYPRTDFPDIRKKAIIHADTGNLIIIPREGDVMVRFYIELPSNTVAKDVTLEDLKERAALAFRPFSMEIVETAWWSAYSIGQRRADYFTKANRVFLTGDACHTHSPKAGQGMNVSLQDGYNIGWKLGYVLRGLASPSLLETYVTERQKTATDLIEFDRFFTKLFSSTYRQEHGISDEQFKDHFVKAGRYTAGQATKYEESVLTRPRESNGDVASKLVVGMRFPSVQVVRFSDAKPMQLTRALPSDSRWHIVVFIGDLDTDAGSKALAKIATALETIVQEYTAPNKDPDSTIKCTLVLSGKRVSIEQSQIPAVFAPVTGRLRIKCLHNVYVDDDSYNNGHGHAFEFYGVDPTRGAIVIVRPDTYVSAIHTVDDVEAIRTFFSRFLARAQDRLAN